MKMDAIRLVWLIAIPFVSLFVHLVYTDNYSVPKHTFLSVTALITFVILYKRAFQKKEPIMIRFTNFHILFGLLWLVTLLSIMNVARDNPYLIRYSLDVSLYLFVFFFLSLFFSNYLDSKEKIENILFIFLIAGFVVSTNGILNYYTGYDIFIGLSPDWTYRGRVRSTIGNVIFVVNFLNMLIPPALYFYLKESVSKFAKVFAFISLVLFFYILVVGQVRSEYLSWVVQVIFVTIFIVLETRKKGKSLFYGIWKTKLLQLFVVSSVFITLGVILIGFPNFLNHYKKIGETIFLAPESRFEGTVVQTDFLRRKVAWLSAIEIWNRHKVLGQGIGSYRYFGAEAVAKVCNENANYRFAWQFFDTVHNDYLQILAELGLVGFGLIILSFAQLLIYTLKNFSSLDKEKKSLFATLVLSFVPFAVQMFFCYPAQVLPNNLFALILVSAGIGEYMNLQFQTKFIKGFEPKKLALIGILVFSLLTISTYLRFSKFVSDVYLKQGKVALDTAINLINSLEEENSFFSNESISKDEDTREKIERLAERNLSKALINFYKSSKSNPWNGASYYFLANMMGRDEISKRISNDFKLRIGTLNRQLKLRKNPAKKPDILELIGTASKDESLKKATIKLKELYLSLSLLMLSEKTFPDPLVHFEKSKIISEILRILDEIQDNHDISDQLKQRAKIEIERLFADFHNSALKTSYLVSGGWTTYIHFKSPDIESATKGNDIYRQLICFVLSSGKLNNKKLELIFELADFEREVCSDLEKTGYWGIPDGGLMFLIALSEKYSKISDDFSKKIMKKVIENYKESYTRIVRKLEDEDTFFNEAEKIKKNVSNMLEDIILRCGKRSEARIILGTFEKSFTEATEQLRNFDFSQYVRNYITKLSKQQLNKWNSIYLASPWKFFATSIVITIMEKFQRIPDLETLTLLSKFPRALTTPEVALFFFLYERYQIFKHMYEYALQINLR